MGKIRCNHIVKFDEAMKMLKKHTKFTWISPEHFFLDVRSFHWPLNYCRFCRCVIVSNIPHSCSTIKMNSFRLRCTSVLKDMLLFVVCLFIFRYIIPTMFWWLPNTFSFWILFYALEIIWSMFSYAFLCKMGECTCFVCDCKRFSLSNKKWKILKFILFIEWIVCHEGAWCFC